MPDVLKILIAHYIGCWNPGLMRQITHQTRLFGYMTDHKSYAYSHMVIRQIIRNKSPVRSFEFILDAPKKVTIHVQIGYSGVVTYDTEILPAGRHLIKNLEFLIPNKGGGTDLAMYGFFYRMRSFPWAKVLTENYELHQVTTTYIRLTGPTQWFQYDPMLVSVSSGLKSGTPLYIDY